MSAARDIIRPALVVFALVNVVAHFTFAVLTAGELVRLTGGGATAGDVALYVVHRVALALALVAIALVAPRVTASRVVVVAAATASWCLAIVDRKVYVMLGVHLDSSAVTTALGNDHILDEIHLGARTLTTLIAVVAAIVVTQWLGAAACARLVTRRPRTTRALGSRRGRAVVGVAVAATWLAAASLVRAAETRRADALAALPLHPLSRLWSKPRPPRAVSYPLPGTPRPTVTQAKDILFVQIESLRADVVTPEHMPNLVALQERLSTIRSAAHWSGGSSTEYSTFSLLYGLYPYVARDFAVDKRTSWPLDTLRANGYRIRGSSASMLRGRRDAGFMLRSFDEYREFTVRQHGDENDLDMLAELRATHDARRAGDGPRFQFVFFSSTHYAYYYPPEYERHRPVLPSGYDAFIAETALTPYRTEVRNRYLNSVEWTDHLLGELFDIYADDLAGGRLIVVLTGDHGEELWDRGMFGHFASTYVSARSRVPLVVHLPGAPRHDVPLSSHVDIWPTLFDYLGLAPAVDPRLYSHGRSLSAPPADRFIVVTGYGFPYATRTLCVVDEAQKYWLEKEYGPDTLFSVSKSATVADDPLPGGESAFARWRLGFVEQLTRFVR